MKDMKRTIAIVCGGDSSEHDVSLRSAQGLYSFFDKERYNIYIVDIKAQNGMLTLRMDMLHLSIRMISRSIVVIRPSFSTMRTLQYMVVQARMVSCKVTLNSLTCLILLAMY